MADERTQKAPEATKSTETPPPGPDRRQGRTSWPRRALRGMFILIFVFSLVLNLYLLLLLAMHLEARFEQVVVSKGDEDQTIALYEIRGVIDDDTAARFADFAGEVRDDKDVKALVLRVSSPGGGVSASDQIHQAIEGLKKAGKKVVVSMGGVAASGGYYISAGAHEIVAEPTTITGSIGVIACWPVIKGTLKKIGAEMVIIKSSPARGWKDLGSVFDQPTGRQRAYVQEILDKLHAHFEQVVRAGRGAARLCPRQTTYAVGVEAGGELRQEQVTETEPFNGKVYLADEAWDLGLVDSIGHQEAAIERARFLAGLAKPRVVRYRLRRGLLARLIKVGESIPPPLDAKLLDEFQTPRIQMLWKAQ